MNLHQASSVVTASEPGVASFFALAGVPSIEAGDDLTNVILAALAASQQQLRDGDIVVIAQKIVSKAEGRLVRLSDVEPSEKARTLALEVNKDPRLIELILRESNEVVRRRKDVLIVEHRLGFVVANAGIDQSNVDQSHGETALLLPEDPDRTCAQLRTSLKALTGANVGIVINDSHGRAFRRGTVGVAVGASGLSAISDLRGVPDMFGRQLVSTEVAHADEIAAAASLFMGQAGESKPIIIARGVPQRGNHGSAAELVRPKAMDLFRAAAANSVIRDRRSVRRYDGKLVSDQVVDDLLNAAICAPSAHNRQPWRFVILRKSESKLHLARSMAERYRADRSRDADDASLIEKDVARSLDRIGDAPIVIVVSYTLADMDRYPDVKRKECERVMAVQSTAMAMQNLLLAATASGLGASLMCAPLFCPEIVREALQLPDDWEPQSLITLGYPCGSGKPFVRESLDRVVRRPDQSP